MHHLNETAGTLTLMGSGEMSPGMAETHRRIMRQIDGEVRAVFIDTPAGFELNVSNICDKAVDYFRENFGLELAIASFPNALRATPLSMEAAMRTLRNANYIFSGPGSPTYAVRNWRGTPIFETMAGKLASGSQVVLASAATLSVGCRTIPVYEIYKVGDEPHWVEGLDLLGRYGLELAIVPHWNNNSGGGHDTSHCFIGADRFEQLRTLLPASTVVLGIDEYTACMLAPHEQTCSVFGAGTVTILREEATLVFKGGDTFGFDLLRQPTAKPAESPISPTRALVDETLAAFRQALREHEPASAVGYVHSLMELMRQTTDGRDHAHTQLMVREMLAILAVWLVEHQHSAAPARVDDPLVPQLMQTIIETRAGLRANKQYTLADTLRKTLDTLSIELADTPQGTTWRKKT